jgi:hypothetical protein
MRNIAGFVGWPILSAKAVKVCVNHSKGVVVPLSLIANALAQHQQHTHTHSRKRRKRVCGEREKNEKQQHKKPPKQQQQQQPPHDTHLAGRWTTKD